MRGRQYYINAYTEQARRDMVWEESDDGELHWESGVYDYYTVDTARGVQAIAQLYSGRMDDPLGDEVTLGTWLTIEEAQEACAKHFGDCEGDARYWEDRIMREEAEAQRREELPYEEPEGWME